MLSIGCIQAQRCHTGRCPTGVYEQRVAPARPRSRSEVGARGRYLVQARKELLQLACACGEVHPFVTLGHVELLDDHFGTRSAAEVFGYEPGWGVPSAAERADLTALTG